MGVEKSIFSISVFVYQLLGYVLICLSKEATSGTASGVSTWLSMQ